MLQNYEICIVWQTLSFDSHGAGTLVQYSNFHVCILYLPLEMNELENSVYIFLVSSPAAGQI